MHFKANTNINNCVKKAVPQAAKVYEKQPMKEVNEDREQHGKKPLGEPKPPEGREVNVSATDPERGIRFIAIRDNVDTCSEDSNEFAAFTNLY